MADPKFRRWYRPMVGRDPDQPHRASTPLELLFDLCFVVGVSQAAGRLHHALTLGEYAHGLDSYLAVFFAIWWAWVNFTWFASAFDTDDVPYRVMTLVIITGALILAAGVPRAFDDNNFSVVVVGYVVMRLALVGQWLRVALTDPAYRMTGLRFAIGVTIVQIGWIVRVFVPHDWDTASFLILVVAELAVPVIGERAGRTTWHPTHIAERYGLFTLIVLGEAILASTTAIQTGFDSGGRRELLLALSGAAVVIVFGMWWTYFDRPGEEVLVTARSGFVFGYGHYFVFAAAAAVGAGLTVKVDKIVGHSHLSERATALTIAVPVAIYIACVGLLHRRPGDSIVRTAAFPVAAALVLTAAFLPQPLLLIAGIIVALVAVTSAPVEAVRENPANQARVPRSAPERETPDLDG
jgi:low temperature requirement protein LtrA